MRWKRLLITAATAAVSIGFTLARSTQGQGGRGDLARTPPTRLHVSMADIPWMTTNRYPEWFRRTYRYKELVGWISNWQDVRAAEWKGVAHPEIRMGVLHLDRGAVYPFHFHPAPELYYVIRGTAEWTVGTDTFRATPGTAIHAPPNAHHKMVNVGSETLELLYVWWAPGGDSTVLNAPSSMGHGWNPAQNGASNRREETVGDPMSASRRAAREMLQSSVGKRLSQARRARAPTYAGSTVSTASTPIMMNPRGARGPTGPSARTIMTRN
jgi:quercetin dioxygenase-like cupin family protein